GSDNEGASTRGRAAHAKPPAVVPKNSSRLVVRDVKPVEERSDDSAAQRDSFSFPLAPHQSSCWRVRRAVALEPPVHTEVGVEEGVPGRGEESQGAFEDRVEERQRAA